jgi:hypothetical protein
MMQDHLFRGRLKVLARHEAYGLTPSACVTLSCGDNEYTWLATDRRVQPLLRIAREDCRGQALRELCDYHLLTLCWGQVAYVAPCFPQAQPETRWCPSCGLYRDHRHFHNYARQGEMRYYTVCQICRNQADRNARKLGKTKREARNDLLDKLVCEALTAMPWRSTESTRQALRQQGIRVGWQRIEDLRHRLEAEGVISVQGTSGKAGE